MKGLLKYTLVATPLAVIAFLMLSSFFTSWDGHAVGFRPSRVADPAVYAVVIVDEAGDAIEHNWPGQLVKDLALPVNTSGFAPRKLPEDTPTSRKARYSTFFTVKKGDEPSRAVPTVNPQAISVAVLLWMLGLALRNMWASGSPFQIEAREFALPSGQSGSGTPAAPTQRTRGKQGPPPGKRRTGKGRRG